MRNSGKASLGLLVGGATGAVCGIVFNIATILSAFFGSIDLGLSTLWHPGDIFANSRIIFMGVVVLIGVIVGWIISGAVIGVVIGSFNVGPLGGALCGAIVGWLNILFWSSNVHWFSSGYTSLIGP